LKTYDLDYTKRIAINGEDWVVTPEGRFMKKSIDDPRDLNKTDNIKSLLKTVKINFSVAIREDIQTGHRREAQTAGRQDQI